MLKNVRFIPILLMPLIMASCNHSYAKGGNAENAPLKDSLVQIKELSKGTNSSGYEYVTLGYTLTPAETTYRKFTISAAWKTSGESSPVNEFIQCSIDSAEQTFTITKLQDFKTIITVTLTNTAFSNVKASIDIHNSQRFLGWYESVSHYHVQTMYKAPWYDDEFVWDSLGTWDDYKDESLGYSTIYTDAITTSQPQLKTFTVVSSKYYVGQITGWMESHGRYSFNTASKGDLIGTATESNGSLEDDWWLQANSFGENDLGYMISEDTQSWAGAQKTMASNADFVILEASVEAVYTCYSIDSPTFYLNIDFIIPQSIGRNYFGTAVQSLSIESQTFTF